MTQVQIGVKIWVKIKCSPIWHTKKPTFIWDREHFARLAKCRREQKLVYSTLFINKSCKTERNIYVYKIKNILLFKNDILLSVWRQGHLIFPKLTHILCSMNFRVLTLMKQYLQVVFLFFFLSEGELKTFR